MWEMAHLARALVLEFSLPYSGVFPISASGIDLVLGALIRDPAAS